MKESIYNFPQGIPGFEDNRKFRFIEEEDAPLAQLISVEDEGIGFILMRPRVIFPDYKVDVDAENEEVLNLHSIKHETRGSNDLTDGEDLGQIEVWAIVTLNQKDMKQATLNLKAPLLLNTELKLGVQLIFTDEQFSAKHPLDLGRSLVQEQEGVVG